MKTMPKFSTTKLTQKNSSR